MTQATALPDPAVWPALPLDAWGDTCATLQLWTQVIGKIRLALAPMIEPLVAGAALCHRARPDHIADPVRCPQLPDRFRFHRAISWSCARSDGAVDTMQLAPRSVADFYAEVMGRLRALGWKPISGPCRSSFQTPSRSIRTRNTPRTTRTMRTGSGVPWSRPTELLTRFRSRFIGKASPVHFFWGSFDLAVTRFSGRTAPQADQRRRPISVPG